VVHQRWWLHGEQRHHLQQVILHDVTDRPRLIVEPAAALDAEALRHGDLDALDVVPVPNRLQEGIGKAKEEEILHRLLAEVMVDAKDRCLGEDRMQSVIQALCRGQVVPEGLFDHEAGVVRAAGAPEGLDHRREQARRNG
jgi:hypothetical protein